MMIRIVFCLCLVYLTGCKLLNVQTKKSRTTEEKIVRAEAQRSIRAMSHLKEETSFSIKSDSSGKRYFLKLYPKGVFTYSPTGGFAGSADSVVLSGNVDNRIQEFSNVGIKASMGAVEEAQKQSIDQEERNFEESENKTSPSWKYVLMLGILLMIGAVVTYKFLIK